MLSIAFMHKRSMLVGMRGPFLLTILCILALPCISNAQSEFDVPNNTRRIENEDKLTVPSEKAEEVWQYLVQRFVTNQDFLQSLDPLLTSSISEEYFADRYYDSPDFTNLKNQNGLRHRKRENVTNPLDEKSGRELMQIKVNGIADDPLSRAEYKYDIRYPTYFTSRDDRHPLIGLVDGNQRDEFIEQVRTSLGIDPYEAQYIVTLHQKRRRIYMQRAGVSAFTLSFDEVSSSAGDASVSFVELEPEINEVLFTEGDLETRTHLKNIQDALIQDIQTQFPEIVQDLTPKYNKAFQRMEEQDPWLRQKVLYGESNLLMWAILGVLFPLFLIAFWIFARRKDALALS